LHNDFYNSIIEAFYNIEENIGEIGSFALPIFVEQVCIASTAVVSAFLVSHISSAAIAGVSLVEAINLLIQQVFLSLEIGATVVVAQYCGRSDSKSAGEASIQAMLTSRVIGAVTGLVLLRKEKDTIMIERWMPKKIVWPIQRLILLNLKGRWVDRELIRDP
jgi:Na+-driven multidrug efflux pump